MANRERRLTTIVAIDVAGYSRLMHADEEGTLDRLKRARAITDPMAREHGGRIVGSWGDGLVAEFPSVVEAVSFGLRAQAAMGDFNADTPDEAKLLYRIGVNLGDIIVDGDDIYGDGVNVAARLEALAEPGGICISRAARDQIRDKMAIAFEDLGAVEIKNIVRPVRVFRVSAATEVIADLEPGKSASPVARPTAATALPLPDKPSIAVLPFDNMSGDTEQDYFSDGITEDIITALSKLHWLFVIARNSTFTYKGSAVDVTRVSRELGVRYVLEGSVRKAANRVRITAQLIDGSTGNHVWADRYDRELDDIFALQDEITESIVGRLDTELRVSEMDRARRKPPANLDAWELYQRGQWQIYRLSREDLKKALDFFQMAIKCDPNFALAHAGVAYCCYNDVAHSLGGDPADQLARGIAAGERAVVLDTRESYSHYVLGRIVAVAGQGARGIAELERCIALNPSFAKGYHGLGVTLNWYGRPADGIRMFDMAMRLSPQDPIQWAVQTGKASTCNNLEDFAAGEVCARKAINSRADQVWPYLHLTVALVGQDRLDEARSTMQTARRVKPGLSLAVVKRMQWGLPELCERLYEALRKAGIPE